MEGAIQGGFEFMVASQTLRNRFLVGRTSSRECEFAFASPLVRCSSALTVRLGERTFMCVRCSFAHCHDRRISLVGCLSGRVGWNGRLALLSVEREMVLAGLCWASARVQTASSGAPPLFW